MKTVAISLRKGGTGKTSLAVSLAAELAKMGSVLLVDLDPQGNASAWIGPDNLTAELAGVLFGKVDLRAATINTGTAGLSLLPTAGLGGELNLYAETKALIQHSCIRNLVKTIATMGYQYCVIDLSPAFGALERAALAAADEVITPIIGDRFGGDGLEIFANDLKQVRIDYDTTKPAYRRIVINAIDKRIPKHTETLIDIQAQGGGFVIYAIPVDPVFRKAQTAGLTIQELNGAKKETMSELNRLAADLAQEGGTNG
jgi:chromosome partitioning protein